MVLIHFGSTTLHADETVDYLQDVKPLLAAKCYSCHGVLKQEGGLRLETRALMLHGGESGPVLTPGKAGDSLILERVTAEEFLRMPPADEGSALKPNEIALLRRWIEQGAIAPDEEPPQAPAEHWAFRRIEKPELPESETLQNPVDLLLAQQRKNLGLKVQPVASRPLLIRRLYLDLIGLPPTLEQLHDERPWEEIVDELLASPHYGERWGRHWMDIWRYSDWYGLGAQLRYSQKHLWHWRDWIVNSLNRDLGYDQMIEQMLAGDEIAPDDPQVVAATGFLARNYYLFNRTTWLDSTIEHTGKAFLGMTFNCAKCHDHKYDPISQVDYYNFRAIFEPHQVRLDPIPGVTDLEQDGLPRVFDDQLDAKTALHIKGDPMNPDEDIEIAPRVPELFASFQPQIEPVALPATAYVPGLRDYVQNDHLQSAQQAIAAARQELTTAERTYAEWQKNAPAQEAASTQTEFEFNDNFDAPHPESWELVGDSWEYKNGTLLRTTSTREPEQVRFKNPLPRDFDITCRYTTTGGATYKSVTFRFDQSTDLTYNNYVYSSAHEPGPKIQAAYARNGNNIYPADGRAARPIKVGETYTLRFAVRDRLMNVWLNDEFVLTYQFPDRRPAGHFSMSGFDATVAFDSITIKSLSPEVSLVDAQNATKPSAQDPAVAVQIAQAKLAAAEAQLKSLQATFTADEARYGNATPEEIQMTERVAVRMQAESLAAEAKHELLAAGADENKAKAAQNKLKQAEEKIAAADRGEGNYASLRASRKALETPAHKETDYPPIYAATSTGRRLALAKWITSRENPLTARVAVNHVWMRHFGEPLVESVFDFGLRAKLPRQAELLDFLAAEFIESGWSFKHLHRLLVTSQAYQLSSSTLGADAETLAADPGNEYYWRMNTRRMESQVVRDCLLHLAGVLDPTLGGPSLEVGDQSKRRSLYFKHSRDQQDKFLTMFDDADLLQCYRRSESIVPQQALALANSKLALTTAGQIAQKIDASLSNQDFESFLPVAFETVLGRPANEEELEACREYSVALRQVLQTDSSQGSQQHAALVRARLIHSLLNHNDFISIR